MADWIDIVADIHEMLDASLLNKEVAEEYLDAVTSVVERPSEPDVYRRRFRRDHDGIRTGQIWTSHGHSFRYRPDVSDNAVASTIEAAPRWDPTFQGRQLRRCQSRESNSDSLRGLQRYAATLGIDEDVLGAIHYPRYVRPRRDFESADVGFVITGDLFLELTVVKSMSTHHQVMAHRLDNLTTVGRDDHLGIATFTTTFHTATTVVDQETLRQLASR